jgi:hypothetical protein
VFLLELLGEAEETSNLPITPEEHSDSGLLKRVCETEKAGERLQHRFESCWNDWMEQRGAVVSQSTAA